MYILYLVVVATVFVDAAFAVIIALNADALALFHFVQLVKLCCVLLVNISAPRHNKAVSTM